MPPLGCDALHERDDALAGNEQYRRLFDLGERLEGVSRHAGVHAAGVLIAPRPLVESEKTDTRRRKSPGLALPLLLLSVIALFIFAYIAQK